MSDTTTVVSAPPTGSSVSLPPTTTLALDCSDTTVSGYDFVGSMHTVVPNDQPIAATITPDGDSWCTGGPGEADVTLTNTGPGVEHVQSAQLVLHGGAAKWPLQDWPSFDLASGESRTLHASFKVPGVNPGTYGLIVYGYDGYANVTIAGPTLCATTDLTAVGITGGSAMGNIRTDLTITNNGKNPCLLSDPNVIEGLSADGSATQLTFTKGTYFGDPPPLASHVLAVGGQAVLFLNTGWPCLDDTHPPVRWTGLRFINTSSPSFDTTSIDVTVDIDTACGLGVSSYGRPGLG